MSGFMSSSTALMICKADSAASLDLDALRQHAFTPDIDADDRRFGWVGLGDPLDTDGFELASVDSRFMGFSFRLDTRKASGAVIRIQLAEGSALHGPGLEEMVIRTGTASVPWNEQAIMSTLM